MTGSEILFLDVPYSCCKLTGCPCSECNCKLCVMPIVMREEARKVIHGERYC